jgi:hypothetical protein
MKKINIVALCQIIWKVDIFYEIDALGFNISRYGKNTKCLIGIAHATYLAFMNFEN